MSFEIIGDVDKNRIYCAGSFTKLLTTFVCLSKLSENYPLADIIDDENFLTCLCLTPQAKNFLQLFQQQLQAPFSIRDLCSFYSGLPYTFDVSQNELAAVEKGFAYKHHSIPDESTFLQRCRENITPVFKPRSKFHYSELSIIFLAYLLEKVYQTSMEDLYKKYIVDAFQLQQSQFSRKKISQVYVQDLSDAYDYPSIAIVDHGFFAYSNGYFTNLSDMKILLDQLVQHPVFLVMVNQQAARAASPRIMNGLTIELRVAGDDILYGYEGLSYSGCNIFAYSTQKRRGYITFNDSEEAAYDVVYAPFHLKDFDKVPEHTQHLYQQFLQHYSEQTLTQAIPSEYQGHYQRVNINDKILQTKFTVGSNFIVIRNPDEIKYDVVFARGCYRIQGKDQIPGVKVDFVTSNTGQHYMGFDGSLYRKI